jgi:hypothetical protein
MKAFVYATGVIGFGKKCGNGSIGLARSADDSEETVKAFKDAIEVMSRHGYKPGILLVPGVPEAEDQAKGLEAVDKFKSWMKESFVRKTNPCGIVI